MKLLLTLDFPPERGGIQHYLFERAAHRFCPQDRIVVGCGAKMARDKRPLPCPVARVGNALSRINKKWSIVNLFLWCAGCAPAELRSLDIECGNVYAAVAPWLLSFFRPVRYRVFTYGGELLGLRGKTPVSLLLKSVLRRSEALYALGQFTHDLLRSAGLKNEIVIEPPRIALPPDKRPAPAPLRTGFSPDAPLRLLSVGRLVPHKGHEILVDACIAIPPDLPWYLTIVGTGPLEKRLAEHIGKVGLVKRVTLIGGISDRELSEEYGKTDLFVHPSIETARGAEGFGIALLEAMAAGVPIIASRTGGIPEALDDGACGVLVKPGDAMELSGAIVRLAGDRKLREVLTQKATKRLKERYAWK
jgi:glycosyltransferase involved in cell wall biosynthesis